MLSLLLKIIDDSLFNKYEHAFLKNILTMDSWNKTKNLVRKILFTLVLKKCELFVS